MVALREEISSGTCGVPWSMVDNMVQYSGHLYIPPRSPLLQELVQAVHEDGHEGVQCTLH
jgi:hypothetical protein